MFGVVLGGTKELAEVLKAKTGRRGGGACPIPKEDLPGLPLRLFPLACPAEFPPAEPVPSAVRGGRGEVEEARV